MVSSAHETWTLPQALSLAEREKQVLKSQIRRSMLAPRAQVCCCFGAFMALVPQYLT